MDFKLLMLLALVIGVAAAQRGGGRGPPEGRGRGRSPPEGRGRGPPEEDEESQDDAAEIESTSSLPCPGLGRGCGRGLGRGGGRRLGRGGGR